MKQTTIITTGRKINSILTHFLLWTMIATFTAIPLLAKDKASLLPPTKSKKGKTTGITPRIINGSNAAPGEFPWMTGLLDRDEPDRFDAHFCGGALIHPFWVITAAHCLDGRPASKTDVLVGGRNLNGIDGERIAAAEIILHPDFNPNNFDADLALIRLATPSSAPVLRLADLPDLESPGLLATTIGWGATDPSGSNFPSILQKATLPLIAFAIANGPNSYDGELTQNMIAAGTGATDSCGGDSGGPLFVRDLDNEWALVGITSFGFGCADPDYPGIYTRVTQFRRWILNIITPQYSLWEVANMVTGTHRNPDNDQQSNFDEFAFLLNPNRPDVAQIKTSNFQGNPVVRIDHPLGDEVAFLGQDSSNLLNWSPFSVANRTVNHETGSEFQSTFLSFLGTAPSFVRVSAIPATTVSTAPRPLSDHFPAFGSIDQYLTVGTYLIDGLSPQTRIAVRADGWNPKMELRDPDSSALIRLVDNESGGLNAEVTTIPASGRVLAKVLPESPNDTGPFRISAYQQVSAGNITENQTINSSLTTADAVDPNFLPKRYYFKDFRINFRGPRPSRMRITMTSGVLDCWLYLFDEEGNMQLLFENDDRDDSTLNSEIVFDVPEGIPLIIRASTAEEESTGPFALFTNPL